MSFMFFVSCSTAAFGFVSSGFSMQVKIARQSFTFVSFFSALTAFFIARLRGLNEMLSRCRARIFIYS